jgi:hypothetical protein
MLYIGHFSFDEVNVTELARHGYFTMVTTATNAEKAVEAFKSTIKAHKDKDKTLDGMIAVYIEDIIEIPSLPEEPVITRLQSSAGEFPESISHSLPGVEQDDIKAYGYAIDVLQIKTQPVHAYKEMTPFLRF